MNEKSQFNLSPLVKCLSIDICITETKSNGDYKVDSCFVEHKIVPFFLTKISTFA